MGSNISRVSESSSNSKRGRAIDGPHARATANQNEIAVRGASSVDGHGEIEKHPVQSDTGQFAEEQSSAVRDEVAQNPLKKPAGSQVPNGTQEKIDKGYGKSAAVLEREFTSPTETQSKNQDGVQMTEGQMDASKSVNRGTKLPTYVLESEANRLETDGVNIERKCGIVASLQGGNEVQESRQGCSSRLDKNCMPAASKAKESLRGYQPRRLCSKQQTTCAEKYMNAIKPKANSTIHGSLGSSGIDVNVNNTRNVASKTYVYNNEDIKEFQPFKEPARTFEAYKQGKTLIAVSTAKEANHVLPLEAADHLQQALSPLLNRLVGLLGEVPVTAEVTIPGLADSMSSEKMSSCSPQVILQLMIPEQILFDLGHFLKCYLKRDGEANYILSDIEINQPMLDRLTTPGMVSTSLEQMSTCSKEDILNHVQRFLPQRALLPLGDRFPKCCLDRGEDGIYRLSVEDIKHPLAASVIASVQNQKSPGVQSELVNSIIRSAKGPESPHSGPPDAEHSIACGNEFCGPF